MAEVLKDDVLLKAFIGPALVDVSATAASSLLIALYSGLGGPALAAITVGLAAASLAFIFVLYRRWRRLVEVRGMIGAGCNGVLRYDFTRDVLTCVELKGDLVRGACYSGQESRLYCVEASKVAYTDDTRDFYCVRFEGGAFEDRGEVSIYIGRLRLFTGNGVIEGQGSVRLVRLGEGKGLNANICLTSGARPSS
ncbi:MAG: hypothetical protein ACP5FT_00235 [Acidilobus sp.]